MEDLYLPKKNPKMPSIGPSAAVIKRICDFSKALSVQKNDQIVVETFNN